MAPIIPISAPPWTILGYRKDGRPIHLIAGGAEGEPVVEPDDTPGEEQEAEPVDDWTPPSREDYEKLVEGKRKADAEAAARRKYLRQHGIDPKTGNKINPDPEPEPDDEPPARKNDTPTGPSQAEIRRQIEKATAEAELRGMRKTKSLVTGVNSALSEAGWNGTRLGSLMKLVDLDEVDIDEDGEITGLAEQIDQVKADFPELFKRTRGSAAASNSGSGSGQNGAPAAKVDAADKPAPKPEPKGWAQQLAERALRS
ncbi:phage scaffolding protein [Streptomyces mirabilis]|uniref:phage scaffolding protein n=1 Tax=Streptomyces mirabilis TaxID=68239 RepID=UPI0036578325